MKQQPSMLLGPAVPGFSLVSFHFLWAILCPQAVRPSFLDLSGCFSHPSSFFQDRKGGVPISPGKFQCHKCTQHYPGYSIGFNLLQTCFIMQYLYKQTGREGRQKTGINGSSAREEKGSGKLWYHTCKRWHSLVMGNAADSAVIPTKNRRKIGYSHGPHR